MAGLFDNGLELFQFGDQGGVARVKVATDLCQHLNGLIATAIGDQPSWRIWQKRDGNRDDNDWPEKDLVWNIGDRERGTYTTMKANGNRQANSGRPVKLTP